jgi:hypothetical protein
MMMRPSENFEVDLRAWAAQQLNIAGSVTPAEARAGLLRLVEREGGVPHPAARAAYHILARPQGAVADVPAIAEWDMETRLAEEVNAFAAKFFTFEPAERMRRWAQLKGRCHAIAFLAARLNHLKEALNLNLDSTADMDVATLARHAGELFTCRGRARAMRRQELLSELESDPQTWERAARTLQNLHPDLAQLDPEFIRCLADRASIKREQTDMRRQMRKNAPRPAPADTTRTRPLVPILVLFAVASAIIRLAVGFGPSSNPPSNGRVPVPPGKILTVPNDQEDAFRRFIEELERKNKKKADQPGK